MELEESQVRGAVQHLGTLGWARLATGPGSRTAKYRQLFGEALDLLPSEVSILGVLMLRGPQTVAELKTRTERLFHFGSNEDVAQTLTRLDEKELVHLLPKQPGQREERWTQLLAEGPTEERPAANDDDDDDDGEPGPVQATSVERRLAQVEQRLGELERLLAERGILD
jgi:uncharacterized protein YceH (UPF0502 family)